ncbi:MAG: hypothetical protein NTW21_06765 [Verrucomicrobia bacterium]|nr:hypothetical protein [Verrucomicrobiota bacterium]
MNQRLLKFPLVLAIAAAGICNTTAAQPLPGRDETALYQPPGVLVYDPWLLNANGTVHLFHLNDVWHATSQDCVHWEPDRAIMPQSAFTAAERNYHGEQEPVWTGCAVQHEGKIFLFWTANKGINQRLCNRTCLSISSDGGKTFTQHPDNPIIRPDACWYDTENDPAPAYPYHAKTHPWSGGVDGRMALMDWRDIAIIKDPKTGLFHGYITARLRDRKDGQDSACIARVTSRDLVHWEVHPPAFHGGLWGLHEVPDVFQLGGKWYLTMMACYPREGVRHGDDPLLRWGHLVAEADTPEGPFKLVKNNCLMAGVENANSYYSMRSVDFKGERLAFACTEKLSLGVKLKPREGGGVQDVWWPENEKLFGPKQELKGRDDQRTTVEFPPAGVANFMLTANLKLGTASAAGITFQKAGQGDRSTLFLDSTNGCFDWVVGEQPGKGRVAARTWPLKPGSTHMVRVVCVDQHIVVYIDNNYGINGRGLNFPTAALALASIGGKAELQDVHYWGPRNGTSKPTSSGAGSKPAVARVELLRSALHIRESI